MLFFGVYLAFVYHHDHLGRALLDLLLLKQLLPACRLLYRRFEAVEIRSTKDSVTGAELLEAGLMMARAGFRQLAWLLKHQCGPEIKSKVSFVPA